MTSRRTIDVKAFIDAQPIWSHQWLLVALCFLVVAADGMEEQWGISRPAFGL